MARGTQAVLAAAALLAVTLAGCSGGGDANEADDGPTGPESIREDAGAIQGLVLDDEEQPVANATVAIIEANIETSTDGVGRFVIKNVPAGSYSLIVQRLGFDTVAKSVSVAAGQTTELSVSLERITIGQEFFEIFEQTKRVDWGVRIVPAVGGYAGGDQNWDYETEGITEEMDSFFIEMEWEGTQALAAGMRLRVEVDGEANELDYTFCVLEGPSPLTCYVGTDQEEDNITMVIDNDHSDCPGDDTCHIQWRGFTGTGNTGMDVDFGVMLDQEFTVYTSHFYNHYMPPGYTARPDA